MKILQEIYILHCKSVPVLLDNSGGGSACGGGVISIKGYIAPANVAVCVADFALIYFELCYVLVCSSVVGFVDVVIEIEIGLMANQNVKIGESVVECEACSECCHRCPCSLLDFS